MESTSQKYYYYGAVVSLLALIVLCIAWETILSPLRPGGSWLALKAVPLLIPLRGVFKRDVYTLQWTSMFILIYFTEGVVRASSDPQSISALLGWIEVALVGIYFFCAILYLKPYKKAARHLAKQALLKAAAQKSAPASTPIATKAE